MLEGFVATVETGTPVDNSAISLDFSCMQMDRTAFKQQSFREAADHQSTYCDASVEEQAQHFLALSVSRGRKWRSSFFVLQSVHKAFRSKSIKSGLCGVLAMSPCGVS